MSSQSGFDRVIQSQVDLMRLSGVDQRKIFKILNDLEKELKKILIDIDPGKLKLTKWKQKRLEKLKIETTKIINSHYKEITNVNNDDLFKMSKWESVNSVGILDEYMGVKIAEITYTTGQLKSLVNNSMIDGRLIKEWWKDQSINFQQKFQATMQDITNKFQQGVLKGESLGEMIKSITDDGETPGLMKVSKRDAEALVRTSYQQVAQEVRMGTYEGNEDIVRGIKILATLDNRTTPICRSLDQLEFKIPGYEPIGHNQSYPGTPPYHWRCFIDPQIPIYTSKGWKPIGKIEVGDLVLTHKGRFRKVTELIFTPRQKPNMIKIYTNLSKISIELTEYHPLMVNGDWKIAKNVKPGDRIEILFFADNIPQILDIEVRYKEWWSLDYSTTLYNFAVDEDESYIANGFTVHNCRTTIAPITKSWAELSGPKSKLSNRKIREIERKTTPVQRESMGGKVKGDMTYNAWLKTQSKKVQIDVLGETKRELWLQKKLTMQDMVNQYGRPLTIEQLEKKYGKLQ